MGGFLEEVSSAAGLPRGLGPAEILQCPKLGVSPFQASPLPYTVSLPWGPRPVDFSYPEGHFPELASPSSSESLCSPPLP